MSVSTGVKMSNRDEAKARIPQGEGEKVLQGNGEVTMVSYFDVEYRMNGEVSEKACAEAQRAAKAPVVEKRIFLVFCLSLAASTWKADDEVWLMFQCLMRQCHDGYFKVR